MERLNFMPVNVFFDCVLKIFLVERLNFMPDNVFLFLLMVSDYQKE